MRSYRSTFRCDLLVHVGRWLYQRGGNEYEGRKNYKEVEEYNGFGIVTDGTSFIAYALKPLAAMACITKGLPVSADYGTKFDIPWYGDLGYFGINSGVEKVSPDEALTLLKADLDEALIAALNAGIAFRLQSIKSHDFGTEIGPYRGFLLTRRTCPSLNADEPQSYEVHATPVHPTAVMLTCPEGDGGRMPCSQFKSEEGEVKAVASVKMLIDKMITGEIKMVDPVRYRLPTGELPAA